MSHSYKFLNHTPVWLQQVFIKIRNNVDKYANLHYKSGVISYTERSNPKLKRKLTKQQARQLWEDLWG